MIPSRSILAFAVWAAMNALAHGQTSRALLRPTRPLESVSVDLTSGTVTRGAATHGRSAATVLDFDNLDLTGFLGTDTGGGFCEWFDAGTKGAAGNRSDLMDSIVFAYCSAMKDPSLGGPGGSVKLGFYEGYTLGGGAPSTGVVKFTLTGLPANSASSAFGRSFTCFLATVRFDPLVPFADGPIGYSWKFLDTARFTGQAGTWPMLSCVTSCSGAPLRPDGQGMTDAIDEYCPPGRLRSTFNFGTASGTFTSIAMSIREAGDLGATATNYNAALTPNPDQLLTLGSLTQSGAATADPDGGACLGGTWQATVLGARNLTAATIAVRSARLAVANGVQGPAPLPFGAGGRLLTSGSASAMLATVALGASARRARTPIPASFALLCQHFAAQAVTLGAGGVQLSSAVEGTLGTF